MAADFVSYWHHRWMHSRFLWAFHSVHHEQRELTALTSGRKHLVEAATTPILLLALAAVLGSPPQDALWFFVLKYLKDATLHSGLRWSYGPLYWIVVSPLFHSAHHSTEVEVSNSNFGVFFSFWDMIFGTHRYTSIAPDRQGVEGLSMPTLWSQFWLPFKMVKQSAEGAPISPGLHPEAVNHRIVAGIARCLSLQTKPLNKILGPTGPIIPVEDVMRRKEKCFRRPRKNRPVGSAARHSRCA